MDSVYNEPGRQRTRPSSILYQQQHPPPDGRHDPRTRSPVRYINEYQQSPPQARNPSDSPKSAAASGSSRYDASYSRGLPISPRSSNLNLAAYSSSSPSATSSTPYNESSKGQGQYLERPAGPYRSPSLPTDDRYPSQPAHLGVSTRSSAASPSASQNGEVSPTASASSDPGVRTVNSTGPYGDTYSGHLYQQSTHTKERQRNFSNPNTDSLHSQPKNQEKSEKGKSPASVPSATVSACFKCQLPVTGQFVRALGTIYHLDCFKCADCGKIVAQKFFPVDSPDGGQFPLCETDYFRRLNLLCAKCGCALRGSYITALDKKFHVEHFTCSVCPTVFGPQDSYYEHEQGVYCHFHYSTRFAVKCTGCQSAILKQFVEINRYDKDEHWHPECYMIHKFWNTKVVGGQSANSKSKKTVSSTDLKGAAGNAETGGFDESAAAESSDDGQHAQIQQSQPIYLQQEQVETPDSLREKQRLMEDKVYRIWTVLSTFEESSAACISEMLKYVSNSRYSEAVGMAEKFVMHVEALFAAVDDLNGHFQKVKAKDISHVREARMLCKKIVNFFSLLSHTNETGARKTGISQELLSLVTGLAHYLKILIRIALTAALRIEREHGNTSALTHFLNRLDRLARDPEATRAMIAASDRSNAEPGAIVDKRKTVPNYGYKSLARPSGTIIASGEATSDLCEGCRGTVEDECVRLATKASLRWHLWCLRCTSCGKAGALQPSRERDSEGRAIPMLGPPILPIADFRCEIRIAADGTGSSRSTRHLSCAHCLSTSVKRETFDSVTRLEQYAFLLCVALNKLHFLLKQKGLLNAVRNDVATNIGVLAIQPNDRDDGDRSIYDTYRDSAEIKRMKSVTLDRKLSTTARIPKRSTVVESPAGRTGQTTTAAVTHDAQGRPLEGHGKPQRPPPVDPEKLASFTNNSLSQPLSVSRPDFNRTLTAVKVVDDHPKDVPVALAYPEAFRSATENEAGITLADLPQVIEAEKAKLAAANQPNSSALQTPWNGGGPAGVGDNRCARQSIPFLSELSALEHIVVKHAAALILTNEDSPLSDIISLEDMLELIEARKNGTFWGKIFKGNNEKKATGKKKHGVFGIALDNLIERGGVESILGAGPNPVMIPAFVDDVILAMKQMDMSVEGVFRKNGNIRRLKELSDALDRDPSSINLVDDNPVQLAALLKKFLRELPDPLFTFKMHPLYMATQRIENEEQRMRILHLVTCLLPRSHRETTEVLFIFLKWVASFSHIDEESGSRMDLNNLATVICPNILYAKGRDPTKDESFLSIRTVCDMLEHQDRFWQVPQEISAILKHKDSLGNPADLTSKDILRYCRQYVGPKYPNLHQQPSFTSDKNHSARERPMSWQVSPHQFGATVHSPNGSSHQYQPLDYPNR